MEIIRQDGGKKGRFVAMEQTEEPGKMTEELRKQAEELGEMTEELGEQAEELGEMTYYWLNDHQIIIDHTGVNPSYEGRGVGKALFLKAVAFAREKDIYIIPECPFVKTMFKRFPETTDVLTE